MADDESSTQPGYLSEKLKSNLVSFKIPLALILLGSVLVIGGLSASNFKPKQKQTNFPEKSIITVKKITIDISGAVKNPGVYQLEENSRIEDAVIKSGGFTDDVDSEYVAKVLNMAQKLSDGTKIYIPFAGEDYKGVSVLGSTTQTAGGISKVNINSATQAELEALSYIGPVTASKIISGRPYQKIEELLDRKIISKSVFDKLKENFSVY